MALDVLGHYPRTGLGTSFFLRARWATTPYFALAARLPRRGRILDLGCGHGLFTLTLALESPELEVLGIDHDPARIRLAREAGRGLPSVRFEEGSFAALPSGPFDGISLIDVLHYFPYAEQEALLTRARDALASGGTLIFREVDPQGGLVSKWNQLYEKLATASGFTRSKSEELFFRSRTDWEGLLAKTGFEARSERCSSPLFADILFIGRKR